MGPVVVHCSAGVGRSACIVMVDVILKCLFTGQRVEMEEVFKKLRDQRAACIPIDSLYIFVAYSVIDYIRAKHPKKYRERTQKFIDEFKNHATK
ncbi:hypothetical protein COOONC_26055 [Cooperia oncophora]